ncbi:phosphonate metabolism transcriptional regulator PhnF [Mesorhizobium tianshanense]|uniref:GntR family phosphonate transport system transcriptional regulator n=1 Tax=Mesorhizobium tianshanense TaxID=39844 RepID=A0A562NM57_9HYPH|nr:phosphonate metabolism transcriptional regulator PhnF [Mesorhizobium tianshanense]TWI33150.1 GntR family phosphonate transport system transcriptional regulator [Mesorhizobium tianshanense]GLS34979.1 phosphonate metabolism transcriptional regulator PhnF [Mesorhizobium tianshanense]
MPLKYRNTDERRLLGRKPGPAVWKQIEDVLSNELIAGVYPPGSKLPTEPELMARFSVGRHTLRQTMAGLEARGLVRIEQGRGTFVHDEIVHYRISSRTRFSQNLMDQNRDPAYQVVGSQELLPLDPVRTALNLSDGALVTHIEVNSFAGKVIIATGDVYFPAKRFPDITRVYTELSSTTKTYQYYGIEDYRRRTTRISSRPPTEDEARKLFQPMSRPILITRKIDVDPDGVPISYSETRWCADRVELTVEY